MQVVAAALRFKMLTPPPGRTPFHTLHPTPPTSSDLRLPAWEPYRTILRSPIMWLTYAVLTLHLPWAPKKQLPKTRVVRRRLTLSWDMIHVQSPREKWMSCAALLPAASFHAFSHTPQCRRRRSSAVALLVSRRRARSRPIRMWRSCWSINENTLSTLRASCVRG